MLSEDLAESVLAKIKEERPEGFCAKRDADYLKKRRRCEEILKMIDKYGLPQDWNADGKYGPERYIEAHVWTDEPLKRYMSM